MDLKCSARLASAYKSRSQIARVLTESWCARELYCPACISEHLLPSKVNTPAVDFTCPLCEQLFQLKSFRRWNPNRIPDAGYDAMIRSIRSDRIPNLFILQYSPDWFVRNLLLVPHFFFPESIIERRRPLAPHARRAGWVGRSTRLGTIEFHGPRRILSANPSRELIVCPFARIQWGVGLTRTLILLSGLRHLHDPHAAQVFCTVRLRYS